MKNLLVMNYLTRELLKGVDEYMELGLLEPDDARVLLDWSHYQRHLEGQGPFNALIRPPTFDAYRRWKRAYPGWTDGILDEGSLAWKIHYKGIKLPMNEHLKRCERMRRNEEAVLNNRRTEGNVTRIQ